MAISVRIFPKCNCFGVLSGTPAQNNFSTGGFFIALLIFHSDRGSQYTAIAFRNQIFDFDILPSYSAKACPFDNAVLESFFRFLKQEFIRSHSFTSFSDLKLRLTEYIDLFYNRRRPHSANNFLTPAETEEAYYALYPIA